MRGKKEVELARWLRGHHGVITTKEALALGISNYTLLDLVDKRRMRRLYKGVYAEVPSRTTAALTASAAALAAAGPRAALSHRSGAWVLGLLPQPPGRVELLMPVGSRSRLAGASIHRSTEPFVVLTRQDLRVTDPVRTIIDIAAVAPRQLSRVVDRGLSDRLVHIDQLEAAIRPKAQPARLGVAVLRADLLERGHLGAPHPSVPESLTRRRVFHRHHLPAPEIEVVAGWFGQYRIDFAYPVLMLAIEVDGYVWHSSPEHMAADNARRNHLRTLGWHVLVYTWVQVTRSSEAVAGEILENYRRLAAA